MNFSYPGYNELLTGSPDPRIDSNDKRLNPNVTVFDYLAEVPGAASPIGDIIAPAGENGRGAGRSTAAADCFRLVRNPNAPGADLGCHRGDPTQLALLLGDNVDGDITIQQKIRLSTVRSAGWARRSEQRGIRKSRNGPVLCRDRGRGISSAFPTGFSLRARRACCSEWTALHEHQSLRKRAYSSRETHLHRPRALSSGTEQRQRSRIRLRLISSQKHLISRP